MNRNAIGALFVGTLVLCLSAATTRADVISLAAELTCAKVVSPCGSCPGTAKGFATLRLDTVANTLLMRIEYQGLSGAETSTHIHGPANVDQNAGVIYDINNGAGGCSCTGVSPKVATWSGLTEQQKSDLIGGLNYIQIHTSACPSGEIRGHIVPTPILISEHYESTPLSRKCIEFFNNSDDDFDLAAHGYKLVMYKDTFGAPQALDNPFTWHVFGTGNPPVIANSTVVLANSPFVICANDILLNEGVPTDLILESDSPSGPCVGCFVGCCDAAGSQVGPINRMNGDDALGIFGPDIQTPFDNCIDIFGVPLVGGDGPRGNRPTEDAAWERKFTITRGITDLLGFDQCNFDGLKTCALLECPPGTPVANATCLAQLDTSASDQWAFEGLNPGDNNTKHSLGIHVADQAPLSLDLRVVTQLDTNLIFELAAQDLEGNAFDVIIETLPASGTLFDGPTNINTSGVPYTMSDSADPLITFVPPPGDNPIVSFSYRGDQIAPPLTGNTATVEILIELEFVKITEVNYNPGPTVSNESQWEWIEIHNTSLGTFPLGQITSSNCGGSFDCTDNLGGAGSPLMIGPGETIVIVGNISTFGAGIARTDQEFLDAWGFDASQVFFPDSLGIDFPLLRQLGAQLFLHTSDGRLMDFVPNYRNAGFPDDNPGHSIHLALDTADNNEPANWVGSVLDCALGIREGGDLSIASPGFVPGAGGFSPPCAFSDLTLAQVGAPITVTLDGQLGGVAGQLRFNVSKLPVFESGFPDDFVGNAELYDGPTTGGTAIHLQALPYTLTHNVSGVLSNQVTYVDPDDNRHFITFQFQVFEDATPAEVSNAANKTIAVQGNSVVITEIMSNPANSAAGGDETYWEYIEIINTGLSSVTLGSMQASDGFTAMDFNLDTAFNPSVGNAVLAPGEKRILARDALDFGNSPPGSVRLRTEFEAEWFSTPDATKFTYLPNPSGASEWDGLFNAPAAPGRFITIWDDTDFFFLGGLLDVVPYQIGQNGWPANQEGVSIFYRGDANGAPFTTTGNDLPANWQEHVSTCAGDGSFESDATDMIVDVGSPLSLPTDPDACVPVPCASCIGDLNGDNKVDGGDIQDLVDLIVTPPGPPVLGCADLNGDGDGDDYLPDVDVLIDALLFGDVDCPASTVRSSSITVELTGAPVAGDIELFIGGCDPALACDTLKASPAFICFERITVTPATTAVQLAEELAFGLDRVKDGVGGLDEFCLADGADVNVTGATISIVLTRPVGEPIPCCYVQDTDGRFSVTAPFDFVEVGGSGNCVVANLLNGVLGDAGVPQTGGFRLTKSE